MSCHGYEGVMPVLCTPLQVKCYQHFFLFYGTQKNLLKKVFLLFSALNMPLVRNGLCECNFYDCFYFLSSNASDNLASIMNMLLHFSPPQIEEPV